MALITLAKMTSGKGLRKSNGRKARCPKDIQRPGFFCVDQFNNWVLGYNVPGTDNKGSERKYATVYKIGKP